MQAIRRSVSSFVPPFSRPSNLPVSTRPFSTRHLTAMTTPTEPPTSFKLALCQIPVTASKSDNLTTARQFLKRASAASARLAVLPECFNSPYDTKCFREYAEPIPPVGASIQSKHQSPTLKMLQGEAKITGMYIVGGSIPEVDADGRIYNTSMTVSPEGTLVAKHRKVHLFDIDVPGGIRFKESDVLCAGDKATVFEASELGCKVGVGICYDVRFPELAMMMTRDLGAHILVIPGAFNMTTGPAHWELLMRARAVDNQVFVAACSPAREEGGGYVAWGHSMVVDPWGTVIGEADVEGEVVVADVELEKVDRIRKAIPVSVQRRGDIYGETVES